MLASLAKNTTRINDERCSKFRVKERDQKERDIVLPGNPAIGGEVYFRQDVAKPVLFVRYRERAGIFCVVQVPAAMQRSEELCVAGVVTYNMTLQKPNPPDAALRNLSLD